MLSRSQAALPTFKPIELSNTIWAVAKVSHQPDPAWLDMFMAASLDQLKHFAPTQLANVVWSLALLRCAPSKEWMAAALDELQPRLSALNMTALSGLIWALPVLAACPSKAWLGCYLAACFECGVVDDTAACAHILFCVAAIDLECLQVRVV